MAKEDRELDFVWQSVNPMVPYSVNYEGRKKDVVWEEKPQQQMKGPCVSYVEVRGITYLNMVRSLKLSPSFSEDEILIASRKARGREVPILSDLEKAILKKEEQQPESRLSTAATS